MKNVRVFYLKIFSLLEVKFSIYLNRLVFVMSTSVISLFWAINVLSLQLSRDFGLCFITSIISLFCARFEYLNHLVFLGYVLITSIISLYLAMFITLIISSLFCIYLAKSNMFHANKEFVLYCIVYFGLYVYNLNHPGISSLFLLSQSSRYVGVCVYHLNNPVILGNICIYFNHLYYLVILGYTFIS